MLTLAVCLLGGAAFILVTLAAIGMWQLSLQAERDGDDE